jgi:hypothetical protein
MGDSSDENSNSNQSENSNSNSNSNSNDNIVIDDQKKKFRRYISKQPTTIEEWVEARRKFPNDFTYTESGDLVSAAVLPSESEKIIVVPEFEPASLEYIQEYKNTRKDEAIAPEEEFVQKKRELKDSMVKYKRGEMTADAIVTLNQQLRDYEIALNQKVKYPRKWDVIDGEVERMLTFGHYDTRKFAEPVGIASYTTVPMRELWMPKVIQKEKGFIESVTTMFESSNNSNQDSNDESNNTTPKRAYTPQQIAIIRKNRARQF